MNNLEKIEINIGQYVWVDRELPITTGDYRINDGIIEYTEDDEGGDWNKKHGSFKIIAASPSLNLEGVPDDVEWLAEQKYHVKNTGSMFMPNRHEVTNIYKQEGFIEGYKTAEQEMFTEEQVCQLLIKFNQEIREVEDVRTWFEQIKSEKK